MPGKAGRPRMTTDSADTRQKIIDAAVEVIRTEGADAVTVRRIVKKADVSTGTFYHHFQDKDDLLIHFVRFTEFAKCELNTPLSDIAGRVTELYSNLIDRYMELGKEFMYAFYTAGNKALSAYMGLTDGQFAPDTIMAKCEEEIRKAIAEGILKESCDAHTLSADCCTIVKGTVFEWCLSDGNMDAHSTLERILRSYFAEYQKMQD